MMRLYFKRGRPDDLKTLHPSYFALVMATGTVAIAMHLHGAFVLPTLLFWLNIVFFVGLTAASRAGTRQRPGANLGGDTESTAFGFGTFASRSMVLSGGAVARASRMSATSFAGSARTCCNAPTAG
jgi:hypothetical protein